MTWGTTGPVLPVTYPGGRVAVRAAVRALAGLLLLGWAVTLAMTVWILPRESTHQQLRADIAAGRVTGYRPIYALTNGRGPWNVTVTGFSSADGSPGIAWSLHDGRTRWASLTGATIDYDSQPPLDTTTLEPGGAVVPPKQVPEVAPLVTALERAGATREPGGPLPWQDRLQVAAGVIGLGALVLLLAGPPPRRGSKWFWFWASTTISGVGIAAWVVLEHLRPPEPPAPALGPGLPRREVWLKADGRLTGLSGFVLSLGAGTAMSFVLSFF